ncbi:hypothetical protein CXP39_01030 [Mesoplasma syrphidae]|uniref:Uncharacterized protein n=1 Tax=Mesoplasma syrphidae TaxID=225999 RepID=A0A2K9C1N6_9MOLU|nr:hypothetical protein [Mesoplasma syrphidae]AUF83389.1 hypothetical protein CXP39_01030 [Mesoplasma syrphidae]
MLKILLIITCSFGLFGMPLIWLSTNQNSEDNQIALKEIEQPIVKTFSVPKRWPLLNKHFNYSFNINLTKFQQELIQSNVEIKFHANFIDEIENDYDFFYKQYHHVKSVNQITLRLNQKQQRKNQRLKELAIVHVTPFDAETFLRNLEYFFAVEINSEKNLTISVYKEKDLNEHSTFAFKSRKIILKDTKIAFLKPYKVLSNNQLTVELSTNYFDQYETNFNELINLKINEVLKEQTQNLLGFKKFYENPQFTAADLRHFSALNFENKVTVIKPFLQTNLTQKNPYLNSLIIPKIVVKYQPIYELKKMFKNNLLVSSKELTKINEQDVIDLTEDYKFMFDKYLILCKISNTEWKVVVKKEYQEIIRGEQTLFVKSNFKDKVIDPKPKPDIDEEKIITDKDISEDIEKETVSEKNKFSSWETGALLVIISVILLVVIFLVAFAKKNKNAKKKG